MGLKRNAISIATAALLLGGCYEGAVPLALPQPTPAPEAANEAEVSPQENVSESLTQPELQPEPEPEPEVQPEPQPEPEPEPEPQPEPEQEPEVQPEPITIVEPIPTELVLPRTDWADTYDEVWVPGVRLPSPTVEVKATATWEPLEGHDYALLENGNLLVEDVEPGHAVEFVIGGMLGDFDRRRLPDYALRVCTFSECENTGVFKWTPPARDGGVMYPDIKLSYELIDNREIAASDPDFFGNLLIAVTVLDFEPVEEYLYWLDICGDGFMDIDFYNRYPRPFKFHCEVQDPRLVTPEDFGPDIWGGVALRICLRDYSDCLELDVQHDGISTL